MWLLALLPPGDKWIFLAWVLLCIASLAVLWSVTEPILGPYELLDPGVSKSVFYRQAVWMVIGYAALLIASRVQLRYLDNIAIPLFLFSVLLLILILLVGPTIGGARRWLALGPVAAAAVGTGEGGLHPGDRQAAGALGRGGARTC